MHEHDNDDGSARGPAMADPPRAGEGATAEGGRARGAAPAEREGRPRRPESPEEAAARLLGAYRVYRCERHHSRFLRFCALCVVEGVQDLARAGLLDADALADNLERLAELMKRRAR